MRINRVAVYKTELPYVGGSYGWGAGHSFSSAMASVLAHFAASTPRAFLQNTTDLMSYNTRSTGLGVQPDFDSLGAPVAVYEA